MLCREPEVALLVEYQGVGIGHWLRHGILRELAAGGVQSTDVGIAVTGIPDLSPVIDQQVVRVGARRYFVTGEIPATGFQPAKVVACLATKPDRLVRGHVWIARSAAPWHLPLHDVQQVG